MLVVGANWHVKGIVYQLLVFCACGSPLVLICHCDSDSVSMRIQVRMGCLRHA